MKTKLLLLSLCVSALGYSQVQPTVQNATFDNIAKSGGGSACACSGWINKSLADQAESSTVDGNDVVKFDDFESDGIYQEIAVVANSDYELDLEYTYKLFPTTTSFIEITVLKGSAYVAEYTPAYAAPADAEQDNLGYQSIAAAELAANQIIKTTIVAANTDASSMSTLSFNSGSETSIAIFIRAIGAYDASSHGDSGKDKGWMNGDSEIRMDNLTLVNTTVTLSTNLLESSLNIYPNPVKDFVTIEASDVTVTSVEAYNVVGQKLLSTTKLNNNKLNVSKLNSGVYLLKINADGKTLVKKIIKE